VTRYANQTKIGGCGTGATKTMAKMMMRITLVAELMNEISFLPPNTSNWMQKNSVLNY
jgi:hypothetical protein